MLDSLIEAGGFYAISNLMGSTLCPVTLLYTLDMISVLLEKSCPYEGPDRRIEIANIFFEHGEWMHLALSKGTRSIKLKCLYHLLVLIPFLLLFLYTHIYTPLFSLHTYVHISTYVYLHTHIIHTILAVWSLFCNAIAELR